MFFSYIYIYIYHYYHSYGILWLIKHYSFRDKTWDADVKDFKEFMIYFFVLFVLYDTILPLSCMKNTKYEAPNWLIFLSIFLFVIGTNIMIASDSQKHFMLKYNKGNLIDNGMWLYLRQPNYIGEMLLYISLALLTRSFLALIVIIWQLKLIFIPNIKRIEKRLSRYPQWKQYKAKTFSIVDYF